MRAKAAQANDEAKRSAFAAFNWLLTAEVADHLRSSADFVRDRIKGPCTCEICKAKPEAKRFRFKDVVRRGRDYLIAPEEVERYFEEHKVADAA